jgi:hypothetical protein
LDVTENFFRSLTANPHSVVQYRGFARQARIGVIDYLLQKFENLLDVLSHPALLRSGAADAAGRGGRRPAAAGIKP